MKSPVFSIITPSYNRAKILPRAIQSVISQKFEDWELLIIDDGSIDNTKDIVQDFIDPRIHYIYQSNRERGAARNNGIRHAKGEYICFLDSDDYYLENHLSVMHSEIENSNNVKAFYYTDLLIEDKKGIHKIITKSVAGEHPVNFAFNNLLQCNATCIHRDLLMENQFDERFTVWEDMHLWLRILLKHPLIKINSYTAVMTEHTERSINGMFNKVYINQIDNYMEAVNDFFEKYGKEIEPYISKKNYREFVHKKLSLFAQIAIQNKQIKEAVRLFFRILNNKPVFILNPQFSKLVLLTGMRMMTF
jgi:glycosyltransferase involved in cell wall biosynthesis